MFCNLTVPFGIRFPFPGAHGTVLPLFLGKGDQWPRFESSGFPSHKMDYPGFGHFHFSRVATFEIIKRQEGEIFPRLVEISNIAAENSIRETLVVEGRRFQYFFINVQEFFLVPLFPPLLQIKKKDARVEIPLDSQKGDFFFNRPACTDRKVLHGSKSLAA